MKQNIEKQLEEVRYINISAKISSITGTIVIYFTDITVTEENQQLFYKYTKCISRWKYKNENKNNKQIVMKEDLGESQKK